MNQLTRRRWNVFFRQKRAWVGLGAFLVLFFFSMTAELWSNSRPLALKYEGHWFFPAVIHYPPATFGITDSFVVDFKALKTERAVFAVNPWDPYEQLSEVMAPPSAAHWLGTDSLGRDVTARLIYGTRVSLSYGLMFWLLCFSLGITVGMILGLLPAVYRLPPELQ